MKYNKFLEELEQIDSDHKNFSIETPLREDAFDISDDEKISIIQKNVNEILQTLGMDMTDDSLKGTPLRVAKAVTLATVYALHADLVIEECKKEERFEDIIDQDVLYEENQ